MGKKLADLHFTNRLYKSAPFLFAKVNPTALSNPKLLHVNTQMLHRLGLDESMIGNPSFLRFLNGDLDFEGLFFGASFYSGHQFGHYVPRLGDGRAITIAEIKNDYNEHFELQLKGSGLTPFSRMGDGKAVVRSSIREYLASAHMKALSIPTTEALAIITGADDVYREEVEKSSIVLRVAESFLRFGHFQYFAHTNQLEELKTLVEFAIENYFSAYKDHPNRYVLFFQDIVKRTAKLFAGWQSVGFCHGVLNTDNMSILGLTLDYGPYGFINHFDQDHVCNHSDHEGRYSLGNQPSIGMWNLQMLGIALESLIPEVDRKRTLETYPQIFLVEYRRLLLEKCGLYKQQAEDEDFLRTMLNMLVFTELDYTQFFRGLSRYEKDSKKIAGIETPENLINWLDSYDARLNLEETTQADRHAKMLLVNPKFILRNYLAQMAIDDLSLVPKMYEVMTNPFTEWSEVEEWAAPAPLKYRNLSVSCSS
ncbi:YdiU family protein [Bacteriovorax sp. PP10]|uniref:Protein nucleotidyltransferase YdiU n=1 Tax=Bacteriovorax antarcticus TaxID=3088717 RepID=A0ABU5VTK9_9BACT|nr:YdiU family protein [Bacteriovorax sp. PP10]MEA9356391.1 YdiU family protein [Bacteriovorax sp. PP10]